MFDNKLLTVSEVYKEISNTKITIEDFRAYL